MNVVDDADNNMTENIVGYGTIQLKLPNTLEGYNTQNTKEGIIKERTYHYVNCIR